MKKRIIAIALVLMLAVSLLPMGALADGGIYVSVGGKDFTAIDQTIKVGGGTAKLTWEYGGNPNLTLTNVKLTGFTDIGSADGVNYYAGIVYAGDTLLYINCNNCSITAPKHGENDVYEGIYAEGAVSVSGDLSIKNVTVGVESADTFSTDNAKLNIENKDGSAVFAADVDFCESKVVIDTEGVNAIVCGSLVSSGDSNNYYFYNYFPQYGSLTVNLRTNPAYGYENAMAVVCSESAKFGSDVKINVTADYSGYTGNVPVLVAGVYSEGNAYLYQKTSVNMNVKCSKNVAVEGAVAKFLGASGSEVSCRMDINGEHLGASGFDAETLSATRRIEIVMTGTQIGDTGIYAEKVSNNMAANEVYINLDCADAMAIRLPENKMFVKNDVTGEPMNIHVPYGGKTANVTDEGETFSTVTDRNGKPANTVVLNLQDYAFNDIAGKSIDPYRKAILWAVEQGITNGFTPVEFRPSAACNRGQVVTFLWRAKGSPEPTLTENPFVDVYETSPYYKAILWAVEQGITNGFDATHFKPSNPCTRAQVVTFLWRTEGKPAPESDSCPFKDVSNVGSTKPYYEAILWAAEKGITGGYTPTEFRPNVTCNRGQIVTFIYRDMAEQAELKIIDVTVEVNPDAPADNAVQVNYNPQFEEKLIPVNVTAKYSDGSEKTVGILLGYDSKNSELPVPEKLVEVQGCSTLRNTVTLKTNGNNGKMLVKVDFDKNTAAKIDELSDNYMHTDRYCAYYRESVLMFVYDMYKDVFMRVAINAAIVCEVADFYVVGDSLYVKENIYPDSVALYKANLTSAVDEGPNSMHEVYLTAVNTFEHVKNLTFDGTGYNVIADVNGKTVTTHYNFP